MSERVLQTMHEPQLTMLPVSVITGAELKKGTDRCVFGEAR